MDTEEKYFYGNKISDYGVQHGFLDYETLKDSINTILCNDITKLFFNEINNEFIEPDIYSNGDEEDCDNDREIFQYYLTDYFGAETISECTDDLVYYIDYLGVYVWCIDFYGTAWDQVLTKHRI